MPGFRKSALDPLIDDVFIPLAKQGKYPGSDRGVADAGRKADHPAGHHVRVGGEKFAGHPVPSPLGRPVPSDTESPSPRAGKQRAGKRSEPDASGPAGLAAGGRPDRGRSDMAGPPPDPQLGGVEDQAIQEERGRGHGPARCARARLKKLPVDDPDFKEPISGETLAFYQKIEAASPGLWDRWLEVMDALGQGPGAGQERLGPGDRKAQRSREAGLRRQGLRADRGRGPRIAQAGMDELNQAHEKARSAAETVAVRQQEVQDGVEKVEKAGLPLLLQAGAGRHCRPGRPGQADPDTPIRSAGRADSEQGPAAAVALRDRVHQVLDRYAEGRKVSEALDPGTASGRPA